MEKQKQLVGKKQKKHSMKTHTQQKAHTQHEDMPHGGKRKTITWKRLQTHTS